MSTLPTCSDCNFRVDVVGIVEWPVVDDFGVVALVNPLVAVHVELNFREVHADGIVVPFVVANLGKNVELVQQQETKIFSLSNNSQKEWQKKNVYLDLFDVQISEVEIFCR